MRTKEAAAFVARNKKVAPPSLATIQKWAKRVWRIKAFKNPFITGKEGYLGVLAWDIPREGLE
ncbi:hypothetical protein [Candidatus Uabimicrobium amorphum]|uniref:Uncharacterized protein n=1 Tax=Uabimicrobium amorphum TaxID=2596890 RepID=A0A5S9F369_UABAM|nr:hypothetical protein [Candidatus Uabimicrobium amorphum]BBM84427.1 hypothetical protein UABAM_02787 [Candidatus Uabimicrobium amorphum]